MSEDLLDAALGYAKLGWKIVPLKPRDKVPWLSAWQSEASDEPGTIANWVRNRPGINIGLQLGPRSGVIDIEGDVEGAEEDLARLFGGEMPICPTWKAHRGKHRLFKYRDDLPHLAKVQLGKLEIRIGGGTKGAQSVLPPSVHPSGAIYEWLVPPEVCDIPELPDDVVTKIGNYRGERLDLPPDAAKRTADDWERITKGVGEGERNESMAAWIGRDLATRDDVYNEQVLKAAWDSAMAVNAANRPPLEEKELRKVFGSILSRERRQRETRKMGDGASEVDGGEGAGVGQGKDSKTPPIESYAGWRLEIVQSDPKKYNLYSPLWEGHVELVRGDMHKPGVIVAKVFDQTNVWFPSKEFSTTWHKKRGELPKWLAENHIPVPAPGEDIRHVYIAEALLDFLDNAVPLDEDEEGSAKGLAYKLPCGSFLFKFRAALHHFRWEPDRIDRGDLNRLLKRIGFDYKRIGPSRTRIHWLKPANVVILRSLASTGGDVEEGGW